MQSVGIVNLVHQSHPTDSVFPRQKIKNPKSLKVFDAHTHLSMLATSELLECSRIDPCSLPCFVALEADTWGTPQLIQNSETLSPLWLLENLPNMLATHLSMQFGCNHTVQTFGTQHWAGVQALLAAWHDLDANTVSHALVVIAERTSPSALAVLLTKNNHPPCFEDYEWTSPTLDHHSIRLDRVGIVESALQMIHHLKANERCNLTDGVLQLCLYKNHPHFSLNPSSYESTRASKVR